MSNGVRSGIELITIFEKSDASESKIGIEPPLWKRCHDDKLQNALALKDYLDAMEWLKENNVNEPWVIYDSFNKSDNMNLFNVLPPEAKLHVKDLKKYLNNAFGLTSQEKRDLLQKMKKKKNEGVIEYFHRVSNFTSYTYGIDQVDIGELDNGQNEALKNQIRYTFAMGLDKEWRLLLNIRSRKLTMPEFLELACDIESEMTLNKAQDDSIVMMANEYSDSETSTSISSSSSSEEEDTYPENEQKKVHFETEREISSNGMDELNYCKHCRKMRLHSSSDCWFKN